MIKIEQKQVRSSLTRYIRKISVFEFDSHLEHRHRLIPCGCTYLSYNHKDIPTFVNSKRVKPSQRLQIAGPKTDQNISVEYHGNLQQILIEFAPTGFYYLFHESPATFQNKLLDFSQFMPSHTVGILAKRLMACDDAEKQIEILQDYLTEMSFQALPFINYVEEGVKIIHDNHGNIQVKDIASSVHKSERQFNRKFLSMVGVSPKIYAKFQQLHYVINLMNQKEYSSFKEISYNANFYDQSHFDHRFKELVGITPNEFLKSKEHNALKYFTDLVKSRDPISGSN
jgi:AraC-like DNA-binding protein